MIKKLAWLLMCLFLLVSCGGGTTVASSPIGSGGTGSYTSGPVSGMGSIIVNGIRYDVETAVVSDEAGAAVSRSNLKLGMFVEIEGDALTTGSSNDTGTAKTIRVVSDFVGPVEGYVDGATTFRIWGRTIQLNVKTVMDANIQNGDVVAVYGLLGPSGYTATRVERVSSTDSFKITGKVASWNHADRFSLGVKNFEYTSGQLPAGFGEDIWVRVKVARMPLVTLAMLEPLPVESVSLVTNRASVAESARLDGRIGLGLSGGQFVVNGVTVNTNGLSVSGLDPEARVSVRGRLVDGVLVATAIVVKSDDDSDQEIELFGYPTSFSAGQLTVRGVAVVYDGSTNVDSNVLPINTSKCLEIRGTQYNSNHQLVATRIKLDNSCH